MSKHSSNYIIKLNFSNKIHWLIDLRVAVWSLRVSMAMYTPQFWLLSSVWAGVTTVTPGVSWCVEGNKDVTMRLENSIFSSSPSKQTNKDLLLICHQDFGSTWCFFIPGLSPGSFPGLREHALCVSSVLFFPIRSSFSLLLIYFQSSSPSQGNLLKVISHMGCSIPPEFFGVSLSIQALCCYPAAPKPF